MTKRELDEYLVRLKPKPVFNPSIRKQRQVALSPRPAPPVEETPSRCPRPMSPSPSLLEPARPAIFNFRFAANGDFKKKFERLAEVLGVENPLKNMAEVFERAVEISLDKKDPKRKLERRRQRRSRPDEVSSNGKAKSRYIPSEIRERVHERAGYQCQYKASDGRRCSSRTGLEIEHQRPFAIYRSHDERFLKALCRRHNGFEAECVYGAEFIRAKIDDKTCDTLEAIR